MGPPADLRPGILGKEQKGENPLFPWVEKRRQAGAMSC
jgi:hypothetical protein